MIRATLLVASLSLALGSCAGTPATPGVGDGEFVYVTTGPGLPLADFVKLGQSVTGETFTFEKKDAVTIKLIGTVQVEKTKFLPFMKTILRVHGLEWRAKRSGATKVFQISQIPRNEVVKLEHIDPRTVIDSLKKLDQPTNGGRKLVAVAHEASHAILLSGSREQIVAAKDVIARLDRRVR